MDVERPILLKHAREKPLVHFMDSGLMIVLGGKTEFTAFCEIAEIFQFGNDQSAFSMVLKNPFAKDN
jgi:hypothetical protein